MIKLSEGDSILVGADAEVCVQITCRDGNLLIKGPMNNKSKTYLATTSGIVRVDELDGVRYDD